LFPPDRTADALRSEGPDRALATERYRRFGERLGVDLSAALESADVERANDRLTNALAERLVTRLHERYDSAAVAARSLSVHEVTIVVRTWSA
jgi:hypothetical protein